MISILLKHSVHLKWYQLFWNILYILNDINSSETPCISEILSIFFQQPEHLKWYSFFWNTLYINSEWIFKTVSFISITFHQVSFYLFSFRCLISSWNCSFIVSSFKEEAEFVLQYKILYSGLLDSSNSLLFIVDLLTFHQQNSQVN